MTNIIIGIEKLKIESINRKHKYYLTFNNINDLNKCFEICESLGIKHFSKDIETKKYEENYRSKFFMIDFLMNIGTLSVLSKKEILNKINDEEEEYNDKKQDELLYDDIEDDERYKIYNLIEIQNVGIHGINT